jgi:hypothetical protein
VAVGPRRIPRRVESSRLRRVSQGSGLFPAVDGDAYRVRRRCYERRHEGSGEGFVDLNGGTVAHAGRYGGERRVTRIEEGLLRRVKLREYVRRRGHVCKSPFLELFVYPT